MRTISLEELLEAGCHFGHQVSRQNSKARDYIFEARDGIHIIDLEKTKEGLEEAAKFVKETAKKNGIFLVLGTKRQASEVIEEQKKRLEKDSIEGVYFVTKRWIGGTLTNFSEVAKNYKKLKDITTKVKDPNARTKYTKKELSDLDKTRQKLEGFYGGVADMPSLPNAIFIVDTHQEHVAANEALKAGIATIGITDTNADPTIITYPIPANDDAVGSLKLITEYIFDAWVEWKKTVETKTQNTDEDKKPNEKDKQKAEEKTAKPELKEKAKKTEKTEKAAKTIKANKDVKK